MAVTSQYPLCPMSNFQASVRSSAMGRWKAAYLCRSSTIFRPISSCFRYLEVDLLKNALNNGRHTNYVNLINLQHPVPGIKDLTAEVEFYSSVPAERASPNIYTADFALEYLVSPRLQIDAGINVGLNKAAPKLQAYTGISYRF